MTTSSLKQMAARSAVWTILGYGYSNALRLGSNLILTRLLVPEFFGLMTLVNTINIGIALFSDYGIGQSLVNNKRGEEPNFINTAWTLQVIRGFQIFLVSLLITYPVAQIYQDKRLLILIPMLGMTAAIDGFSSTAKHLLERRLELQKLIIFESLHATVNLTYLVLVCWWQPTLWALASGVIFGTVSHTITSHFLMPEVRHRFLLERQTVHEIRDFGKWVALASATMFIAGQADRFILAKLLSFEKLGVYTIAYTLASIPRELSGQISSRVIFPAISQQADLPRHRLRSKIIGQRWKVLMGLAGLLALLVCGGDSLIMALYAGRNKHWEQYQAAMWMMPILCSGIWFSVLFDTMSPALLAIGKPVYSANSNIVRFITISVGLPLAYAQFRELGAIIVIAMSDFPLYLVSLYGVYRERLSCIGQDFKATVLFVGFLAILLLTRYSLGFGFPLQTLFQS